MTNYISIKEILDNIMDHPLLKDVTLERAVNYAVQFSRLMGMPKIFIDKTQHLNIENYRAPLPCDFISMTQVKYNGHCMRYTTDSFHLGDKEDSYDVTYKLQNSFIYTSIKEGDIEISYKALLLDEDGFPMIPDNGSYAKALEMYIKKSWFNVLFDLGKITSQVLTVTLQEYAFAAAQAKEDMLTPSVDEMESFTNMWNTLIPRMREHNNGFKNLGTKELIRRQ